MDEMSYIWNDILEDELKLPLALPNWSESGSRAKSFHQINNRFNHDVLPDHGATGMLYEESNTVLIKNPWASVPFAPKRCSMPYLVSNRCYASQPDVTAPINDTKLIYHAKSKKLITNRTKSSISFFHLEESQDDEIPSRLKTSEELFFTAKSAPVNLQLRENDGDDYMLVNCGYSAQLVSLVGSVDFSTVGLKELVASDFTDIEGSYFTFTSFNQHGGMESEILLGVAQTAQRNSEMTIVNYDIEVDKILWQVSTAVESMSKLVPTAMYSSPDHPRLFNYADTRTYGHLDSRIKEDKCYKVNFSAINAPTLFTWERIRGAVPSLSNSKQNFLLTDYHVVLVDDRFSQRALMQWNHGLEMLPNKPLKFMKITKTPTLMADSEVISVSNTSSVCLITNKPSQSEHIIQPSSLHRPLHISQHEDCYRFFAESELSLDGGVESRLQQSMLTGMDIVPLDNGFSVFTLSNYKDIFCQDFFGRPKKDVDDASVDSSWRYFPGRKDLKIDAATAGFLSNVFTKLSAQDYERRSTREKRILSRHALKVPDDSSEEEKEDYDCDGVEKIEDSLKCVLSRAEKAAEEHKKRKAAANNQSVLGNEENQESLEATALWNDLSYKLLEDWFTDSEEGS